MSEPFGIVHTYCVLAMIMSRTVQSGHETYPPH